MYLDHSMNSRNFIHSRREFLRRVSAGTAALATGIGFGPQREPLEKYKGRRLGVALLGLGKYSTNELGPALRQTKACYLAGVVTGHPDKGEKWAASYDLKKKNIYSYENLEGIADNPGIDVIYVVTPPALHPEFVNGGISTFRF